MALFSDPASPASHRVRIVIAEKDITVETIEVDPNHLPEDLAEVNPYNSLPTLVDRELVLYDSRIIMEYLDERFPHPPLMPVDPVSRARARLALHHVERDWYRLHDEIVAHNDNQARTALREGLLAAADLFKAKPFFLSDEFGLADCTIVPILWRLPALGIELPTQVKPIAQYAKRLFSRPSFRESLSEIELEMRP